MNQICWLNNKHAVWVTQTPKELCLQLYEFWSLRVTDFGRVTFYALLNNLLLNRESRPTFSCELRSCWHCLWGPVDSASCCSLCFSPTPACAPAQWSQVCLQLHLHPCSSALSRMLPGHGAAPGSFGFRKFSCDYIHHYVNKLAPVVAPSHIKCSWIGWYWPAGWHFAGSPPVGSAPWSSLL